MPTIVLIGALDTKGAELEFLRQQVELRGHHTVVVDVGVLGEPAVDADVARADVASAGGANLEELIAAADRGRAVTAMAAGARVVAARLRAEKQLDAIIGLGGGAGTSMGTAAMRALPLGIPKVMVSTLASGDTRPYVDVTDIVMVPSVVDIAGLNRISRGVLARAAGAVCGMVETEVPKGKDRPLIAATMFGNTTKCVDAARASLDEQGYEVLVFHATGVGGRTMESLVDSRQFVGVLDVTTTEWADELVGGVLSAGPTRLDAAARTGTPAVVAPGCLDMVNFGAPDTVPEKFRGRRFYQHNDNITLMRTTPEENAELGRIIADKLNASKGPVAVYLPLRGLSAISAPGGPFHWPEADQALFAALDEHLQPEIPRHRIDAAINDPPFAAAMTEGLLALIARAREAAKESR